MHLFVTLTYNCNLQCSYCYGKCCEDFGSDNGRFGNIDYDIPTDISYDISHLKTFSNKERIENLIFYGGEPLLRLDKVREIMNNVPADKYMIQTNGLLIQQLEPEYLRRLHTILVSIDGDEALTDANRGKGVYKKAVNNIRAIRAKGFLGEIIARMTVEPETEIDKQVWHLLLKEDVFDAVHWQLDAQFWRNDYEPSKFASWVNLSYKPRLANLIEEWVATMEEKGKVQRIYPFLGITESLLTGQSTKIRCGAGWMQFNIQTDGAITPCPAMSGMKDYYCGRIDVTSPQELRLRTTELGEPCTTCKTLNLCGGRCLYANITKLWGDEGFKIVCKTAKTLTSEINSVLPRIRNLIESKQVSRNDFEYTRFNSCEIIP